MSANILPTELLDNIFSYLAPRDLYSLTATNSLFYHVAQRHLYRHVNVASRNISCVFTLARNPTIARHVHSFVIRIAPSIVLFKSFYRQLATALSNMSELTSLQVTADQAVSWVMRTRDDSTFHNLQRFACSFHLDGNLVHFLNKADALLELEIDSLHDSLASAIDLRRDAMPRLSQFTGSSKYAQYFVPGRPVEHIHLNAGDLTEDVAESLGQSTAPINVLAAATSSHSVSLIKALTQCMEHLVHLRIVTTYNFSDAPDSMYFSNISDALTSLPDLQSCEIWGLHWVSSKKSFHDQTRVWKSEPFNTSPIPPNNFATNGTFLEDLYSDFSYAY